MAFVIKNRVQETTVTTGTGTMTLLGATQQHQAFSAIGNTNTTCYLILSGNLVDWEVGIGTYTLSGTTLSRTTILESSNAGSAISLVGTSLVTCTNPAQQAGTGGLFDQMFGATNGFAPIRTAGVWTGATPGGGGAGSLVLISTLTASASASLDFTGLGSTYDAYLLVLKRIVPSVDGAAILTQLGEGAGPTWKTTGYASAAGSLNTSAGSNTNTSAAGFVWSALGVSNVAANGGQQGAQWIHNLAQATYKSAHGTCVNSFFTTPTLGGGNSMVGMYTGDQGVGTALRVIPTSGNLTSGSASLYGVAN